MHAEKLLPDVGALRRYSIATWRYQFTRNLESPRFAGLVTRLTQTSAEAARLWAGHEVAFPPHQYPVRIRTDHGIAVAGVTFSPVNPRLWLYTMVLPPGVSPPAT